MCVSYASKMGGKSQQKIQGNQSSHDRYWKIQEKGLPINCICTHRKPPTSSMKMTPLDQQQEALSGWAGS